MLENNAGETPYMVAHKYQQFDAERLLLNIEQQHGETSLLTWLYLNIMKLISEAVILFQCLLCEI